MANFNKTFQRLLSSNHLSLPARTLLKDTQAFLIRCPFSTYQNATTIMEMYYRGMSDSEVGDILDLSATTVRIQRQEVFRRATTVLGDDYLNLIQTDDENSLKMAEKRLGVASGNYDLTSHIEPYFLNRMRVYAKPYHAGSPVPDFRAAVKTLLNYTKASIDSKLEELDPVALGYVLEMLEGFKANPDDKARMAKFLGETD